MTGAGHLLGHSEGLRAQSTVCPFRPLFCKLCADLHEHDAPACPLFCALCADLHEHDAPACPLFCALCADLHEHDAPACPPRDRPLGLQCLWKPTHAHGAAGGLDLLAT